MKLESVVLFDVPADVPHRELTRATDAGAMAAEREIGAKPTVAGSLASARDGKRRVRIAIGMQATPAAALLAERAFADAFCATLEGLGYAVSRS